MSRKKIRELNGWVLLTTFTVEPNTGDSRSTGTSDSRSELQGETERNS